MDKIEVRNAVKKFGKVVAVDQVSFSVEKGEILSLLGPSGCGKTTLLRLIAGLEDLDEGEIFLDGKVVTSPTEKVFIPPEKRRLGLMFQSYALWPHMTVYANIAYGLKVRKFPKQEIKSKVKENLDLVGLSGLENRYPAQLSGGQQQRVALARNLAYEPTVLLLDEPLSNLDKKIREKTRGELHSLLKRLGVTAVYVTHDQEEAFVISDRIVLLCNGKIVQQASARELYEKPDCFFAAEFLGRANIFKAKVQSVDEKEKVATIEVPGTVLELKCKYKGDSPEASTSILIRCNEIGMYESKPNIAENLFKGQVISREYRGGTTDHTISIGNCTLTVTSHRFCNLTKSTEKNVVYVYIPPEAIKLIPA